MANLGSLGVEVRKRIAASISEKLKELQAKQAAAAASGEEDGNVAAAVPGATPGFGAPVENKNLRRLAVMLRTLEAELRDKLMDEITKRDADSAQTIIELMVKWEDIPAIADRPLQECLRSADVRKMAVALTDIEPEIGRKIRSNISERMAATIAEEASLMQKPGEKEIQEARTAILASIKEANKAGKLKFVED